MKYYIEIIENLQSLSKFESDWNNLYKNIEESNVFLSFAWVSSWAEFYSNDIKPFVIIVRNDKNIIIAIAPLGIRIEKRFFIKTRILTFLADGPSDYQDFLIQDDFVSVVNEVIQSIIDNTKKWDIIELKEFSHDSEKLQLLFDNKSLKFKINKCSTLPRIQLEKDSNFESQMSKKTRQDIQYQLRRLEKSGTVVFRTVTNEEQIPEFMNSFYDLHIKRWGLTDTPSTFNNVELQKSFNLLARKIFIQGISNFSYLTFNNEMVACHFGFQSKSTFYYYTPAYDPEFAKNSIAKIFLYLLVKSASDNKINTFDFLRGLDNYKNNWGVTIYQNVQLTSIKPNIKGLITLQYLFYHNNRKMFVFRVYRKIIKYINRNIKSRIS